MEYHKNLDLQDIKYFCEFDLIEKTEQWKDVVGYEGDYQISDLGRVKSIKRYKFKVDLILKQGTSTHGYFQISAHKAKIKIKTIKTHQLIAMAFLGHIRCGHDLVINHKDFNKKNNIVSNIELVTARENSNKKHFKFTSEYIGVSWDKQLKKWRSRITINNEGQYLGLYTNEIDAHNAYQTALSNSIKNHKP